MHTLRYCSNFQKFNLFLNQPRVLVKPITTILYNFCKYKSSMYFFSITMSFNYIYL